jgi:hypothetical protein
VARRHLRAAKIAKPKDGWTWPDKAAAKSAIEAVQAVLKAQAPKPETKPPASSK